MIIGNETVMLDVIIFILCLGAIAIGSVLREEFGLWRERRARRLEDAWTNYWVRPINTPYDWEFEGADLSDAQLRAVGLCPYCGVPDEACICN